MQNQRVVLREAFAYHDHALYTSIIWSVRSRVPRLEQSATSWDEAFLVVNSRREAVALRAARLAEHDWLRSATPHD